jgi:hypothetical protein
VASLHDQQNAGGTTFTLAEATKLSLIQAVKLPDSWPEIKRILFAYHRWLQVLLGENHIVPIAFQAMAEQMEGLSVELESKARADRQFGAGLLQSVHYHTWTWVNKQQRSETAVAPPDYASISEGLSLGKWFAPKLPPHMERLLAPTPTPGRTALAHASLPSPAPPPAQTQAPAKIKVPVELPIGDRVTGIYDPNYPVGRVIRLVKGQVPHNATKQQFCLNYHVVGSCSSTCLRHLDHRAHSVAESTSFAAFLQQQMQALAATPQV